MNLSILFRARLLLPTIAVALIAFFSVPAARAQSFKLLHTFDGNNGSWPRGSLVEGDDGRLYGATTFGGDVYVGTLFAVNKDGSGFTTLWKPTSLTSPRTLESGLTKGADGRLYGTGSQGGHWIGWGAIFALTPATGSAQIHYSFDGQNEGYSPSTGAIQGADGRIYARTQWGGISFGGTLVAIDLNPAFPTSPVREIVYSFTDATEGSQPIGSLIQGSDGRLYGINRIGGSHGGGTLIAIDPDTHTASVLHHFGGPGDGDQPRAGVIQASNGRLYGTTTAGGFGLGTIYSLNPDGSDYQRSEPFSSVAYRPLCELVEGPSGRLYGATLWGTKAPGAPQEPTIFSINLNLDVSDFKVLYHLDQNTEGWDQVHLTWGSDNILYGSALRGGAFFEGTLFSLTFAPEITSPLVASGTYGEPFNYNITATNNPTDFDAFDLPLDLSVDHSSGLISGVPEIAGQFPVTIAAFNDAGQGFVELSLTIAKASASITISNTEQVFDGQPKTVTITTTPPNLVTSITYAGNSTAPSEVGSYAVAASVVDPNYAGSAGATLVITEPILNLPVITQQPQEQTATAGKNVTFSVTATSSGALSYQWIMNGGDIFGATSRNLQIRKASEVDAGVYRVQVTNADGSVLSDEATLSIVGPPVITKQPLSNFVNVGGSHTFSVAAAGSEPFSYQWRKGNLAIVNATGSTLTFTNIQSSDAGNYSVVVSNAAGSVTSSSASLTVSVPPEITQQPQSVIVAPGKNATFSVKATGTTPLSYQWYHNNALLANETSSTLRLTKVNAAQSGNYYVVVFNTSGDVTSITATLDVQ